jgi:molybdopterin-guanine dinucleotide biosynthesis protein A
MTDIPGVILAGGLATRMGGGDKALLALGRRPVLAHVIDRLAPQVTEIALNANGDPARFAGFGLPVIADSEPDHPGPLAGVLAGLDWAAGQGAGHIVTVAADTPFFPDDLVVRLTEAAQAAPIALAATPVPGRGLLRQPTFGLWPVALRDDLRAALLGGVRKVVHWADRHGVGLAEFSATPHDPFFNLNRPEDMIQAEDILKARG